MSAKVALAATGGGPLSLCRLLDPAVLADPYPLYRRLRTEAPVHWDPYLHAWVVTRYADVMTVLRELSAERTPTPAQLAAMGLDRLAPLAAVMVRQMLFLDPPRHTRIRALAAQAFAPRRIATLRGHIRAIVYRLLDAAASRSTLDLMAAVAEPLPTIVTAEMLGVPQADGPQLKQWSADFAEMLGNFQHNPDRVPRMLETIAHLTEYFRQLLRCPERLPADGLVHSLLAAEIAGDRLSEEEVIANVIITLVGGQETTTNLIGNGVLTLLRHPDQLERLRQDPSLLPSAIEELLRFESPSQHTARMAPSEFALGGARIRPRQAVIAVLGAANRDPQRFADPDRLDLARTDNRHLAFGWAAHFCFGAALARLEAQECFGALLSRFPDLALVPSPLVWRNNLGLRGLSALPLHLSVCGV